jgi:hypothetical protein
MSKYSEGAVSRRRTTSKQVVREISKITDAVITGIPVS